jgi:Kef-type K+ transport system membrane component KefB
VTDRQHERAGSSGAVVVSRLVQLVALALVSALLYAATRLVPVTTGTGATVSSVASLGYILLAGTLTSELVSVVGLPHVTGYLLAGVLAGPHVAALIDEHSVGDLTAVNTLALSLIALEGGAHLKVATLQKGLQSLAWSTLLQSVGVLLTMTLVFLSLRSQIPFARGLSTAAAVGTALLWGTLAITRSPSATLGILAETRASGPLMTSTLSLVMTSDIVVVTLLATVMVFARPMIDPTASFSPGDLRELGHELLGSVALGTTLGIVLAAYTRFVRTQLLLVFVALGFGMSALVAYVRFDSLLAFMVAGFVVQNLSQQGETFIHALEETGSIVFVVFFATAGAHLDLPLLGRLWPIALTLAGSRALVTWVLSRGATHLAGDPPAVRKWGWAGLVSQAGLALGVAAVIERKFPALGSGFRALATATVALNEVGGPVLFKLALDRAGESAESPRPTLPSLDPD